MKRLLAAFVLLSVVLVFSVGTPGCTKKEPTKDLEKKTDTAKDKKKVDVDVLDEVPKKKAELSVTPPTPPIPPTPPKEEPKKVIEEPKKVIEEPKKVDPPKVDPPKVEETIKVPPKKADAPKKVEPELELPKDEPKKGASLDRPIPTHRDLAIRSIRIEGMPAIHESITAC